MEQSKFYATGLRFGLMAGVAYVLLLTIQFMFGADNPITFSVYKFISYLLILGIFVFAGIARKKELGGFISFKQAFQTIFIVIVITELFYLVYTYVYMNIIEPQFYDNMINSTMMFMERNNVPQEKINDQIKAMESANARPTLINLVKTLGMWIVIDSIFGMIIAAVIKKNRPPF